MSKAAMNDNRRLSLITDAGASAAEPAIRWPQIVAAPAVWEAGIGPRRVGQTPASPLRSRMLGSLRSRREPMW
jgi:hypothetical protein